jgi:hypothetical protein
MAGSGRTLRIISAAVVAIALLGPGPVTGPVSGAAAPRVGGWFLYGANMPWLHWNADFGGGPNGGGVSGNIAELDSKLQAAHNAGMRIIRWWVFEGGSPQIQRDSNGTPTGLNPNVYTDMDAALAAAARFDLTYNFVLFGSTNDDATTHQWWEDSAKRAALVRVLTPLFQRYATHPRIHTWEIVNEPEWQSRNGITTVSGMLATVDALANAIHQNTNKLVTVGNAQMQDMRTWVGHPVDYHSPHYYDNFGTGLNDPFVTPAASVSPDGKPVVIGEWQASSGLTPDAQSRWQTLYSTGYAGGWPWTLSPEHTNDKISIDLAAAAAFARGKSDLGPQASAAPPPPTATPTVVPIPTATATPPLATWTMRARVRSSSLAIGARQRIWDTVTASHSISALVDLEVYDPQSRKVFQTYWDNQSFSAGTARTFRADWKVPVGSATGTYTVMVGTFAPNWGTVYRFDTNAATFTVR